MKYVFLGIWGAIFLFFFCVFFSIGFYAYYLYKYPNPFDYNYLFEYYPKELVLRKGPSFSLPKDRIQHFLNFSPSKEKKRHTHRNVWGFQYIWGRGGRNGILSLSVAKSL